MYQSIKYIAGASLLSAFASASFAATTISNLNISVADPAPGGVNIQAVDVDGDGNDDLEFTIDRTNPSDVASVGTLGNVQILTNLTTQTDVVDVTGAPGGLIDEGLTRDTNFEWDFSAFLYAGAFGALPKGGDSLIMAFRIGNGLVPPPACDGLDDVNCDDRIQVFSVAGADQFDDNDNGLLADDFAYTYGWLEIQRGSINLFRSGYDSTGAAAVLPSNATPVPLPAGLPLMLAGLGAFALIRRRQS